jgi:cytochrome c-type biogenesis protein CcmH/NrfG
MIQGMRAQAWAFLLVGFAIGFSGLYTWTKQRAPEVLREMPLPAGTASQQISQAEPPPPPLDTARVQTLQGQIQSNPQNFEALAELGNIYFDQRNFREASDWYTRALAVRPDDVNLRTDLGTALFYDNRFDDAIAEFNGALARNSTHPQALFNIGVALVHGKNDLQGALQHWEKLVETNPSYPEINVVKEQIRLVKEQLNQK